MLPNLIVIGAQKSGTTSLHAYLGLHPEISMSRTKEPNFFIDGGNWGRGLGWYESQFSEAAAIRGESSPTYTTYPLRRGVPDRMAATLVEPKLLYLVRNPVERMVSGWMHAYASRRESRPFDQSVAHSDDYLWRSRYWTQLELFLRRAPAEDPDGSGERLRGPTARAGRHREAHGHPGRVRHRDHRARRSSRWFKPTATMGCHRTSAARLTGAVSSALIPSLPAGPTGPLAMPFGEPCPPT